jgi:AraC-like DNA-binding protein
MSSTIAATVVARIIDVGIARGVPEDLLVTIIGRPRSQLTDGARVAITAVYELFAVCLQQTNDASFPLRVASAVTTEDYSVLGFALMTSVDVTDAFDRLVRYGHMISDSGSWSARDTKGGIEIAWNRAGRRTLGHRAANECALAELLGGMRRSYGRSLAPVRVSFRHPAPVSSKEHQKYFAAAISWGADKDCLVFGRQILQFRAAGENSAMSQFFGKLLADHQRVDTCVERVKQTLLRSLPSGLPSAGEVASRLGMSERSMRRALSIEQSSFSDLLDELRRTIALDMLDANKSVTEIAFVLGFSETSALSRAFRRWYGTSPRSKVGKQSSSA